MALFGVDYAFSPHPSASAIKAAGGRFAVRYIGSKDYTKSRSSKWLSPSEYRALAAVGIAVPVVFEYGAKRAESGEAAGIADARIAVKELAYCGLPAKQPVYFAVDYDTTVGPNIRGYLRGAASVLGKARVGVYGGYKVVKACLDEGLVTYAWQTYAWSGGKWDDRAHIQQYANGKRLGGVSVDFNHATKSNYGQKPASAPAPKPSPKPSGGGKNGVTRSDVVAYMLSLVGTYGPPNNRNKFNKWFYGHDVSGDAYAWCYVFACYVWDHFGILAANGGKEGGCPNFKARFSKVGAFRGKPSSTKVLKPGDPLVYDFNKTGSPEHFGTFLRAVTSTTFEAVEGNTGNDEVAIRTRHISDVQWYAELQGVGNSSNSGGNDVPNYVSLGSTLNLPLETGKWRHLSWDVVYDDRTGQHGTGNYPSILFQAQTPFYAAVGARIKGLPVGARGQASFIEVMKQPDGSYRSHKTYPIQEFAGTGSDVYVAPTAVGTMDKGARLRAQVIVWADGATVHPETAKVLYWK